MKSRIYALIPAKSYSRRLKNKNLLKIKNKSLIEIAIESVRGNKKIYKIFISTNSKNIFKLAKKLGADAIIRKNLNNNLPSFTVIKDFINQIKPEKKSLIIYLQPTSPLRNYNHVKVALNKFIKAKNKTILISLKKGKKKVLKSFYKKKGNIIPIMSENTSNINIQNLPDVFYPNGAIYIFKVSEFLKKNNFPNKKILPFIMNHDDSIDIDSKTDFINAKKLFLKLRK